MARAASGGAESGATIYECGLPEDKAKYVIENDDGSVAVGVLTRKKWRELIIIPVVVDIIFILLLALSIPSVGWFDTYYSLNINIYAIFIVTFIGIVNYKKHIKHKYIMKMNDNGILFPSSIDKTIFWNNIKELFVIRITRKKFGLVINLINPMRSKLLKIFKDETAKLSFLPPNYSPLSAGELRHLIEHYRAQRIDRS